MAITPTDLKLFKSANNTGGAITATAVSGTNVLGIFTGQESADGKTIYGCIYLKNDSAQTAFSAKVYVNSETVHTGVNATIGLGASAIDGTEASTVDEITAPTGVTFSEADGESNALLIGDMLTQQHKALWIRLSVAAGTLAKDNYTIALGISVDSGE